MNLSKYSEALQYATEKHSGQYRIGGIPYISHPIAVASKILEKGYSDKYILTALFHDLLEDTNATEEEILSIAGDEVLTAVKLLTKEHNYNMDEYISKIKSNPIAKTVKTYDRLHNLECAVVCSDEFKLKYINETKKYYLDFDSDIVIALDNLVDSLKNNTNINLEQVDKYKKHENNNTFILHGDICYSKNQNELCTVKDGYLISVDGISHGVYDYIPEEYSTYKIHDYKNKLIIPGLVDLHIHAPQFAFRGTGMDLELMDWLKNQTFPEEIKYEDLNYADKAYQIFADSMRKSATTHAVIFATKHRFATELLMNKMEETGIISYVGKVNMDREAPLELIEESAEVSAYNTFGWINSVINKYNRTFPILTPRFIPCCSDKLMEELREIQITYDLPVQSHLSENKGEIDFVRMLCPDTNFYGEAYDNYGFLGFDHRRKKPVKTIMAHCVYSTIEEMKKLKENSVYVAHCPASNMNLSSGIAPIRKYLNLGLKIGLGTDVAGGHTESMFRAVCDAVQVSKLYWRLIDNNDQPLSFKESFYLATISGGEFFGKVGSFDKGYNLSAVVIDDSVIKYPVELSIEKRLESAMYSNIDNYAIISKYVNGEKIFEKEDNLC